MQAAKAREEVAAALGKLDRAREKADEESDGAEYYFSDGSSSDE